MFGVILIALVVYDKSTPGKSITTIQLIIAALVGATAGEIVNATIRIQGGST